MVYKVTVDEAQAQLVKLIEAVKRGDEVIIESADDQQFQLVPLESKRKRKAGTAEGLIWMSDDFDEPLEDFKEYME